MKNLLYTTLFLIFSISTVKSQMSDEQIEKFLKKASPKEMVQKNTVLMMDGFFLPSIKIANQLIQLEPNNSNYNYRKGFALFNSTSDFSEAIPYLLIGKANFNSSTDLMSANEKSAPTEVLYYLGRSYHLINDISSAKEHYQAYLDNKPKDNERIKEVNLMLLQCENAEEMMKYPRGYEIVNLGDKINTEFPDYAPIISLDGSVLYFTSRRLREDGSNKDIIEPYKNFHKEDVYRSNRIDVENWDAPKVMEFSLPGRNEATVAVSSDERSFYIYKDDAGNGDIYETEYKDNKFQNLVPIKIKGINSDAWEPHITSSADGAYKYFTSDRDGGYGGRDIYRVTMLPNGEWSEPMNLGPNINTEYDEDSPFISVDNKTLYFSHNGDKSIGGFDVFVSVLDEDDQTWSESINLGMPLNSTGDDIYYTTTADGLTAVYSSFRADGHGEKDIYEVRSDYLGVQNSSILKGTVVSTTGEPIPDDVAFTLNCLNCGIDSSTDIKLRPSDGAIFATLEKCREYEMIFHHKNGETEFYREKFKTKCEAGFDETVRHLKLDLNTMSVLIEEDLIGENDYVFTPLEMKHFFDYNGNKLSPSSGGLKEIFNEMTRQAENGRIEFNLTINASASKVPTKTFKSNMDLANTRAQNVVALLKEYVKDNEQLKGKVNFSINKVGVNGPNYSYGTHTQIKKYAPYQYVIIQLDGQSEEKAEIKIIKSKDKELKEMPN